VEQIHKESELVGFGAPAEFGAHIFHVVIPAGKKGSVRVVQDYGLSYKSLDSKVTRAIIPLPFWSAVADIAAEKFNSRPGRKKKSRARWLPGDNKVERSFGKELCLLAWAVEQAKNIDECKKIASRWAAMKPEERHWLFNQVDAEPQPSFLGWYRAIYCGFCM